MNICDKQHIADIFDEYFVNIAKELSLPDHNFYSDFANHSSIKNIHKFMSNVDCNEFSFEYVNPSLISDIVLYWSSSKTIASHADTLRASSRVPPQRASAETSRNLRNEHH